MHLALITRAYVDMGSDQRQWQGFRAVLPFGLREGILPCRPTLPPRRVLAAEPLLSHRGKLVWLLFKGYLKALLLFEPFWDVAIASFCA